MALITAPTKMYTHDTLLKYVYINLIMYTI